MSYDVTNGKADYDRHFSVSWANDMRFPVFPIKYIDVTRCDGVYLRHVNYPNIALELILDGEVMYVDGETSYIVKPGMMFVIVPHSNVKIVNANPGTPRRKITLIASGNAPEIICGTLGFYCDTLVELSDPADVAGRMEKIGTMIMQKSDRKEASTLLYDLMLTLSLERQQNRNDLPDDIRYLKKYICDNLHAELSSEVLANRLGTSQATLRRKVKKYFSCTPVELCNALKLERASALLRTTGKAVKEISHICGFADAVYFGVCFKAMYGCTPCQYRAIQKDAPVIPQISENDEGGKPV